MSHTPGPWFVERLQRTRRFAQHRNMTDPCRILSKSDMIEVAVIDGIDDAELMAASPELLEACMAARILLRYRGEGGSATYALLDAAIKKARGEA